MGGGGIANVGRPDKSVTVHEFGHSFVGLLDEYAVNPGKPFGPIKAPNASTTSDPEKVPVGALPEEEASAASASSRAARPTSKAFGSPPRAAR